MIKLDTCEFKGCGRMVRPDAMADHWLIARHYSPNLPAQRVALADAPNILKVRAS